MKVQIGQDVKMTARGRKGAAGNARLEIRIDELTSEPQTTGEPQDASDQ